MAYPDQSRETSQTMRTVSAFFDDLTDAEDAVAKVRALGIPEGSIRLTQGQSNGPAGISDQQRDKPQGFFEMLGELFFPSQDRHAYAEGLNRGGHLVTVTNLSGDEDLEAVVDILDNEGAVDMDERTESWRAEGWLVAGYEDGRQAGTLEETSGLTGFDEDNTAVGRSGSTSGAAAGPGGLASAGGGADMAPPAGAGTVGEGMASQRSVATPAGSGVNDPTTRGTGFEPGGRVGGQIGADANDGSGIGGSGDDALAGMSGREAMSGTGSAGGYLSGGDTFRREVGRRRVRTFTREWSGGDAENARGDQGSERDK